MTWVNLEVSFGVFTNGKFIVHIGPPQDLEDKSKFTNSGLIQNGFDIPFLCGEAMLHFMKSNPKVFEDILKESADKTNLFIEAQKASDNS